VIDWEALGYATGIFILVFVAALVSESTLLLLIIGLPSGFVAGYRAGGLLKGSVYGLLIGAGIALIFILGASYLATRGRVAPGVGLSLVVVFLVGVFLTAQSLVAGAVGGLFTSHGTEE
jgi:hypothetical protein